MSLEKLIEAADFRIKEDEIELRTSMLAVNAVYRLLNAITPLRIGLIKNGLNYKDGPFRLRIDPGFLISQQLFVSYAPPRINRRPSIIWESNDNIQRIVYFCDSIDCDYREPEPEQLQAAEEFCDWVDELLSE